MTKELKKQSRPRATDATVTRIKTGCGNIYITIGKDEKGMPIEIFATLGKAGGCAMAQLEALGRSISLGLKYGLPLEEYIDQLDNIRCSTLSIDNGEPISSCADAIASVLKKEYDLLMNKEKSEL